MEKKPILETTMNDLTKEELQHLKACVSCTLLTGYSPSVQICDDLYVKLQSLIDNYCDHTWTDGSGNHIYCASCQAYGGKR